MLASSVLCWSPPGVIVWGIAGDGIVDQCVPPVVEKPIQVGCAGSCGAHGVLAGAARPGNRVVAVRVVLPDMPCSAPPVSSRFMLPGVLAAVVPVAIMVLLLSEGLVVMREVTVIQLEGMRICVGSTNAIPTFCKGAVKLKVGA